MVYCLSEKLKIKISWTFWRKWILNCGWNSCKNPIYFNHCNRRRKYAFIIKSYSWQQYTVKQCLNYIFHSETFTKHVLNNYIILLETRKNENPQILIKLYFTRKKSATKTSSLHIEIAFSLLRSHITSAWKARAYFSKRRGAKRDAREESP